MFPKEQNPGQPSSQKHMLKKTPYQLDKDVTSDAVVWKCNAFSQIISPL